MAFAEVRTGAGPGMTQVGVAVAGEASLGQAIERANALIKEGRLSEAESLAADLLRGNPDHPALLQWLGVAAFKRQDMQRSIDLLRRAIARGAGGDCHVQLANVCRLDCRLDDALAAARAAVAAPKPAPGALFTLGKILGERHEFDEAFACLINQLRLDPQFAAAHLELGYLLLLKGEYRAGWQEYAWRYRMDDTRNALPAFSEPEWNGMILAQGRVLMIGDQGYGDALQFARFIPRVRERCAEVLLGCSPELLALLTTVPGVGRAFVRWEDIPRFEMHGTFSSLPGVFGVELASVPADVPYVRCDPARVRHWAAQLDASIEPGRLRVGIVWSGRLTHPGDPRRSMRWSDAARLAAVPGVALISLQKDMPAADGARFAGALDLASHCTDFMETASIVQNLDLVVTIDTAAAHLAGALGKPVWILLAAVADWRWGLEREDCPWYPTARLFRQKTLGNWSDPVAQAERELRRLAAGERARLAPYDRRGVR